MSAPSYPSADRVNRVVLSGANDAAGDYAGTSAATGIAGLSNARTRLRRLRLSTATGDVLENIVKVYRHNGSNYTFHFEIYITGQTRAISGRAFQRTVDVPDLPLPGTGYTTRYNTEVADDIIIDEEVVDH